MKGTDGLKINKGDLSETTPNGHKESVCIVEGCEAPKANFWGIMSDYCESHAETEGIVSGFSDNQASVDW